VDISTATTKEFNMEGIFEDKGVPQIDLATTGSATSKVTQKEIAMFIKTKIRLGICRSDYQS